MFLFGEMLARYLRSFMTIPIVVDCIYFPWLELAFSKVLSSTLSIGARTGVVDSANAEFTSALNQMSIQFLTSNVIEGF